MCDDPRCSRRGSVPISRFAYTCPSVPRRGPFEGSFHTWFNDLHDPGANCRSCLFLQGRFFCCDQRSAGGFGQKMTHRRTRRLEKKRYFYFFFTKSTRARIAATGTMTAKRPPDPADFVVWPAGTREAVPEGVPALTTVLTGI
jgi:hypothetical protein